MINTSQDLKDLLFRINRKSYPAYKDTKGSYRFPGALQRPCAGGSLRCPFKNQPSYQRRTGRFSGISVCDTRDADRSSESADPWICSAY